MPQNSRPPERPFLWSPPSTRRHCRGGNLPPVGGCGHPPLRIRSNHTREPSPCVTLDRPSNGSPSTRGGGVGAHHDAPVNYPSASLSLGTSPDKGRQDEIVCGIGEHKRPSPCVLYPTLDKDCRGRRPRRPSVGSPPYLWRHRRGRCPHRPVDYPSVICFANASSPDKGSRDKIARRIGEHKRTVPLCSKRTVPLCSSFMSRFSNKS